MTRRPSSRPYRRRNGTSLFAVFLSITIHVALAASHRKRKNDHPSSRNAKFLNLSGAKVDFFWVHPKTGELAHSHTGGDGIVWGGESGINTFVGHEFEVHELTVVRGGTPRCLHKECRRTRFVISENEDQVFTLDENFEISFEDNKSRSMKKAKEALEECQRDPSLPVEEQITQLANCMEKQLHKALNQTNEEIEFQASLRQNMGQSLVQYTCDDPNAPTTESFRNESWKFYNPVSHEQEEHVVQVIFETEKTAVKYIPGVLTADQCRELLDATELDVNTRRVLPESTKSSLGIVQILMKMQNLYRSFLGLSVAFSGEPLLVLESYQAEPYLADGECAACSDDEDGAAECAHQPQAKPGVARKMLEGSSDEKEKGDPVFTTLLLVCSAGQGSALHFPRTGTHVATKQPGDAILVIHADENGESEKEKFLQDLAVCQPWMGELTYVIHQHQYQQ